MAKINGKMPCKRFIFVYNKMLKLQNNSRFTPEAAVIYALLNKRNKKAAVKAASQYEIPCRIYISKNYNNIINY